MRLPPLQVGSSGLGLTPLRCWRVASRMVLATALLACQTAWAGRDCDAPADTWQPRSVVHALAERNGWRVDRIKIDDGCYEVKGRDAQGNRLKVKIDPASLKIIRIKRESAEHEQGGERRRGAPPSAPPASAPTGQLTPAAASRFG